MIHLNTHLSKRNEDVNEIDDVIWTHTRYLNTHLSKRNEDVNEVDDLFEQLIKKKWRWEIDDSFDSFEHTFTKEKWRCKWNRWFIWTHTYQREMKM